jgi:hypothetical protein
MIGVVHPGSRVITQPGSRVQGSKRHRIPDPQHWENVNKLFVLR